MKIKTSFFFVVIFFVFFSKTYSQVETLHPKLAGIINQIQFVNDKIGWILIYEKLYKTEDGGIKWFPQISDQSFRSIAATSRIKYLPWGLQNYFFLKMVVIHGQKYWIMGILLSILDQLLFKMVLPQF
ncbi:MAG: hypothetical protein Q8L04_03025 [Ignavibacteria bacterium]|nr:hypothetical protein [Ignavibacteria bacterium]